MTADLYRIVTHPSFSGAFVVRKERADSTNIATMTAEEFAEMVAQEAHEYARSFESAKRVLGMERIG